MSTLRESAQKPLVPYLTKTCAWHTDALPIIERGAACYLYDTYGNEYPDGLADLYCVNIRHPQH